MPIPASPVWHLTGAALAVSAAGPLAAAPVADAPSTTVISQQPAAYHGWPTLTRRRNGELLLVYSGGREEHICPFGRVELMRSHDGGRTWTWPQVILDTAIDDRDAGVLETAKGTLLVTTFTSLAYVDILNRVDQALSTDPKEWQTGWMKQHGLGSLEVWPKERVARWHAAHERVAEAERRELLGEYMLRSTDGGLTWSAPNRTPLGSPHGPIQLADGRVLYAGRVGNRIGVCESRDDGATWQWLAEIPARPGDEARNYHELHAVETAGGRILAQIRNHNQANSGETLQSESTDGGKTWSVPRAIGVWGLPSHLLRLKDGRLVMTYGHRRAPYGVQARVSADDGGTWSEAILVADDGTHGDLGYPSTVELDDGALLTVWYEAGKAFPKAVLRQARWSLPAR